MICKICGKEVEDGIPFCPICGAQMAEAAVVVEEPAAQFAPQQAADPGKALGIASLILGIVSLVSGGNVAAIVGIILGILGKKKSEEAGFQNGPAKIGLILSILGLLLFVLLIVGLVLYYIFIFVLMMGSM